MANQRFLTLVVEWFNRVLPPNRCVLYTLLCFVIALSGCASSTTFRVLDAKTKKPIEGAVALAEWIGGRRMAVIAGPTFGYTAKVIEKVSDSEGKFSLPPMVGSLALQTPNLKVYKAGYVGWDSRRIYLGCRENDIKRKLTKRREGFTMKDQDIYLEPWKDEYSFISHGSFIDSNVDFDDVGMRSDDSIYFKAIEYELPFERLERKALREKRK